MFVMKSLLPSDIQVTDMKNNNSYTLQGRGAMEELSIAAANDTEHEFYLSKKWVFHYSIVNSKFYFYLVYFNFVFLLS